MKYTVKNKPTTKFSPTTKNKPTTKFSPTTKYTTKHTTTTESYDLKDNPVDIPDEEYVRVF